MAFASGDVDPELPKLEQCKAPTYLGKDVPTKFKLSLFAVANKFRETTELRFNTRLEIMNAIQPS